MASFAQERPCIHVALMPGTDEALYRWVEIGAEEEGVPCRLVQEQANTAVAMAYAASRSSKFNIGVSISDSEVILHEMHMPPDQPVIVFPHLERISYFCRLMGANAARMIIRKPFRFNDEPAPFENGNQTRVGPEPEQPALTKTPTVAEVIPTSSIDPAQVARIVAVVVQKLQERGLT
jgi:hypothetical protein